MGGVGKGIDYLVQNIERGSGMNTIFKTISANVYHFYRLDFREKRGRVYMLSLTSSPHFK